MAKSKTRAEFGDFQTPRALAQQVCALVGLRGVRPVSVLEPTCGLGSLLFAALDQFHVEMAIGADINPTHIKWATHQARQRSDAARVDLKGADFFATDWRAVLDDLPDPVLVVGNPPWVTNAHLATLGSQNLPVKSNFQKHRGFDAITGKANFDISEWMMIQLMEALDGRQGTLAMLCKSAVARKTLFHGWKSRLSFENAAIYGIDANLHFDASVDAALLVVDFRPGTNDRQAKVYANLKSTIPQTTVGYEDGLLLADVHAYCHGKHLSGGTAGLEWRSGIKHDCAKVMEMRREGRNYRNGLGELVDLEEQYLYPMLKSSGVANGPTDDHRWMIVPQRSVGEDTASIEEHAPKTWRYLNAHAELLNHRGSSVYRDRPAFSIFGVGEYSFAPWKVAISGFYKRLSFVAVGPIEGKPVVFDDTSYFLPCTTQEQAEYLIALLNSPTAQSYYKAYVFWDAKRPITADLLRRLDLSAVARELGSEATFATYFGGASKPKNGRKRAAERAAITLWSD